MTDETKEKAKSFLDKAKNLFDRGFSASKKAIGVAGEAVQDFSDKSVTTIEIKQLESKIKKQYSNLGEYVNSVFSKKAKSLTADDETVVKIMKEVARLEKEISKRKAALEESKKEKTSAKAQTKTDDAKKLPEAKTTATVKKAPVKAPAKASAAKTTAAKKTATKKSAAETSTAKKTPAAKTSVKKTVKK
ncbi:hypothetical protein [Treponema sp.]|uniref:hypothetical protein n=1 Tax=Treponema sp. TaxID=166 RepID=UPI00298E375C|nr:hypothetical protein [Treponema sp.]